MSETSQRPTSRKGEIRTEILSRITHGDWPPGARVSSEHELMAQFGVSRMTAHAALAELAREGVLRRVKGLGSFVAPPLAHLTVMNVGDPAEEIAARGALHRAEVILAAERPATAAEALVFHLSEGASLFHLVIRHFENDAPVVLEDRLVNPKAAPDFLKQDFSRQTAFAYLMALAPYPQGRHIIRATAATERLRALLDLQPGEPCLEIERTTWTATCVVTQVRLSHPGLRFALIGAIEPR